MIVMIERPSPNHDPRPPDVAVDMLVLHYTGMADARSALDRLCDPAAKVSAHYLVDEDGAVHRLVDETRRAWHAGRAVWRGCADVNGASIGVELVNPGHAFGYRPFPDAQMEAVIALAREIIARHPIPARNVVGHSDVAPARRADPGELFDWARLAAAGGTEISVERELAAAPDVLIEPDLERPVAVRGVAARLVLRIAQSERHGDPLHVGELFLDHLGKRLAADRFREREVDSRSADQRAVFRPRGCGGFVGSRCRVVRRSRCVACGGRFGRLVRWLVGRCFVLRIGGSG